MKKGANKLKVVFRFCKETSSEQRLKVLERFLFLVLKSFCQERYKILQRNVIRSLKMYAYKIFILFNTEGGRGGRGGQLDATSGFW